MKLKLVISNFLRHLSYKDPYTSMDKYYISVVNSLKEDILFIARLCKIKRVVAQWLNKCRINVKNLPSFDKCVFQILRIHNRFFFCKKML